MHVHIYIYIYIERERERRGPLRSASTASRASPWATASPRSYIHETLYIYIYIYIYIHTHTIHMCVYCLSDRAVVVPHITLYIHIGALYLYYVICDMMLLM